MLNSGTSSQMEEAVENNKRSQRLITNSLQYTGLAYFIAITCIDLSYNDYYLSLDPQGLDEKNPNW